MPLTTVDFVPQGPIRSADILQYANLLTGVMTDQPVTLKNAVSIGGSQAVSTVPLKLYGAPTQNTHLIDFYPSPSSTQPGFGLDAYGRFGWGPAGSAVQDTFMSRIATQAGHASDTAGVYVQPLLEVGGPLTADGNLVVHGTIAADSSLSATSASFTGQVNLNNNAIVGVSQLTLQSSAYLSGSTDHVVASNHLNVALDLAVGRNVSISGAVTSNLQCNAALTVAGLITGNAGLNTTALNCSTLNATSNATIAGNASVQGGNGLTIGTRRIYDGGGSQGLHFDWDIRIDSAHDVYTHSIHLVSAGDDCRIDTIGDMNYWGPNGSTNHRFHHVDGSWMGCQAANFVPQSTRDSKAGATVVADDACMTRIRYPISVYTWPQVNAAGPAGQMDIGMMADDMLGASPEFVGYNSDGTLFGIQYMNITSVLWGALRQLDARCQAKGI